MNMYYSIKTAVAGEEPHLFSLLAIGACVVGSKESFESELAPINYNANLHSIRESLPRLKSYKDKYGNNPHELNPYAAEVLFDIMKINCPAAAQVMSDLYEWVSDTSYVCKPVMITLRNQQETRFLDHYFSLIGKRNPFEASKKEEANKIYHSLQNDLNPVAIRPSDLVAAKLGSKNASPLEQAIAQAQAFEELVLKRYKL